MRHARAWQDARRSARQRLSRHREHRIRLRHPVAADGRHARKSRARRRLRDDAPAARRLRRHHAVQLPRDGAAVDVPARARLRKHLRPQAERESSAHRHVARSSCSRKPACPKACSTSCTADASASMRCSRIRKCARSRSSAPPRSRNTSYETGTRHGKRVQANGGAKNYIVVMPDADVPRTVEALATAASAAPANAAWRAQPRSPSARRPIAVCPR